ncbi:hypothetical protein COHA_010730 [Chlorella ohadii]|uniref:Uncharacterized protein n=1 Tax=Chlorella ohadii TaxID=2649997 RepID=A0AAD5GZD7_9CHLO|nr:hypothetical protein COHA_010730 [Chlorella ohadii]
MWPHRLAIQWEWSDCSAKVEGPIRMAPKGGGWELAWWGWLRFWVHPAPLSTPCTLEMEAVTGDKLTLTTTDPYREQDLGGQFA